MRSVAASDDDKSGAGVGVNNPGEESCNTTSTVQYSAM